MKKSMYILTISFALAIAMAGCNSSSNEQVRNTDSDSLLLAAEQGIREANDRLYVGLNDMFEGDMQVLNALWSHSESTTYMGPFGGSITSSYKSECSLKAFSWSSLIFFFNFNIFFSLDCLMQPIGKPSSA